MFHSDQASLLWLLVGAEPSRLVMRCRLRFSELDIQIIYKKGKLNSQSCSLSRLITLGKTNSELDEEIPCFLIDEESEEEK